MFRTISGRIVSAPDYRYFNINTNSHIRLLTLLPGLPSDSIRATLTTVDLADKEDSSFPLYECLSYTWGSTEDRVVIYVDGKSIEVTKNLAEALVHCRHHELTRTLWIDALCINQGDMAERSTQVGRMSEIYSTAARVLIWLGPESDDSVLAIDTMKMLDRVMDLDLKTQTFIPLHDPGNWVEPHTILPLSEAQIEAICNLFSRPYWKRLWVWQEVRRGSSKSLVMCGNESMLWRRFYTVGFFLRWKRERGLGRRYTDLEPYIEIVNGMMNNITQSPMASLSLRTCWSECTEPRDRVYALMGITTDDVRLTPDYSLPLADVYKDVPIQHLAQLNNLELLSSCHWREQIDDLPSWAPHWRSPNTLKRFFDLVGAGEPAADARYINPDTLDVAGVKIGRITRVISLPISQTDESDILTTLRKLAPSSLVDIPYIVGGSRFDAHCRTFFANEFTDRYKPAGELLGFQTFQVAREILLSSELPSPQSLAHFVKDFKIQCTGRVFAVTDSGYVALVPKESRIDDELVHILGSRWPITLRPHDEGFQVVGHAYVDGENDREALLGPLPSGFTGVALYDAGTAKWWPMIFSEEASECQIDDPRLGHLPTGWAIKSHRDEHLFQWYVREGADNGSLVRSKMELRWRSDPRLTVDSLKARGVHVDRWLLT